MRLGIDFGTTGTVVTAVNKGQYQVAEFKTGKTRLSALPGCASLGPAGLRFGTQVNLEASDDETQLLRSVKAAVAGLSADDPIAQWTGSDATALSLVTAYLSYVREMLLTSSNLKIKAGEALEAMIAVPATASARQRYLTIEAFQQAGFQVLGLVNEPTAGAIEFAYHTQSALSARSPKRYVVVYDLGGGTFDAAGVSLEQRRFELIGAEGLGELGGNTFDQIIADAVLDSLSTTPDSLSAIEHHQLLEQCRLGKEALTNASRQIHIELNGLLGAQKCSLDLQPLADAAEPAIAQSLEKMDALFAALREHGIDPDNARELGAVYLVGGSVRFPPVQRQLRARYGRKVQLAPHSHASTAIGLAIAAAPYAGIFVHEAPTRHFGVWRESEYGHEKVFDRLIERNASASSGGARIERHYRPTHAVGHLRYAECSELDPSQQPAGQVTPWQSVYFPYDPSLAALDDASLATHFNARSPALMDEDITETYEYLDGGIVRVTIANRTRGYERGYELNVAG